MKSYVSSFSGSWFQRCLSMVLCFCMVLSLCPLPQHAAASEVEEGQEVSQPVETQPAPQPVETQPAPQPVETQPAPQPVETQPAPQPVETQPAPQPVETQPAPQPVETQPAPQPEETQPVTQPEETQPVTQPEETQEVTQPVETQEVTEPEETQEVTGPEETQETTEPEETQEEQPLVVTAWQWNDEWEALDEETGILGVSFASIENPVYLWSILEVLPAEIFATVDGEVVTLTLGEWSCDDYPTAGAYQGEYVFKTTLPEGYVLAEDAAALEVPVVFYSDASTFEEHTHDYKNGICSDTTCTDPYEAPTLVNNVYQIGNAGQLFSFAEKVNGGTAVTQNAVLTADIVIPQGLSWIPIGGNNTNGYAGTFDGQGHSISGLRRDDSTLNLGLFASVEGGTVRNLSILNSSFNGYIAGGICGFALGITIENCYSEAEATGSLFGGSLIGYTATVHSEITNCGTGRGNLAGRMTDATITNCYSVGYFITDKDWGDGSDTYTNCYYLADEPWSDSDPEGVTRKTAAQFASGEVAYLLNNGGTSTTWGQTIGSQSYPVLKGAVVYAATNCAGQPAYTNNAALSGTTLDHALTDGVCTVCGASQVTYLDASHAEATQLCKPITSGTTELTDGWYVAQGNVTIGGSVTATEDANLILADGCSLTVGGDFLIQGGKSLNIYVQSGGTGSLTTSGENGVGIGGVNPEDYVSLKIYGGRINAYPTLGHDSDEGSTNLSSASGSSTVIYTGADYAEKNGFHGIILEEDEKRIVAYGNATLSCDLVIPAGDYEFSTYGNSSITFSSGAKLQVPDGSTVKLSGGASFPNGIAANVELSTIVEDGYVFQNSEGVIINFAKLTDKTSISVPVALDYRICDWDCVDLGNGTHSATCSECGRSCIEPHWGDPEDGMVTTDDTHSYTCDCGAEVTEEHTWEYWYDGADFHAKYCSGCRYYVEDIPHDFTSGDCVCGAVQVSYSDATGTQQGTAVCTPLNSLDEEELNDALYEGWYLIEGNTVLDSLHNFNDVNLVLANGCCLQISSYHNAGRSVTIWQQPAEEGKATGKLVISGSNYAIYGSGVTIKGGVLELSGTEHAFEYAPTLGSGMKLSVSDGNGGYTPVNFADRTSTLSSATELKLEPCTDHAWGGADDNEYIDSTYHGVRCQYCGIGGDRKEAHSFDANGFCDCGAVQFLDASGNQAVQYCQVLSGETTYYGDISSGWYVVKGNFDFQGTMSGTVNLVLANGSKLYNSGDAWDHKIELDENANLTVYAQSTDPSVMGKLVSTYTSQYGLRASSITINGGNIYVAGMDWAVSGRFAVNGGIVELRATNDIGDVSHGMPSVPVGMRITIVKDEGNVPVTDREDDWSKQQHVIIQPCTDHSVTKGSTYIDDNTHTLMCAYCDVLLEGTGEHDFGTNGVCNCGLVQYLDENGVTKTQLCQKFTGGMENGGWYVLDKDYSRGGFWTEKDANLILAKGVTLNSDVTLYGCTLAVYGQPGSVLNLGNLDTEGGSLSILGGVTQIGTVNNYQPLTLTVNGGILSVDTIEYDDEPVTVNNQRGIYLESGVGQVAGDFTLSQSFTLEDGQILTIPEGAKLTTDGKLVNNGAVFVDGELTDWDICTGEVYYPVKLPEGVTAQIKTDEGTMGDLRENDGKLYAKAEQEIVLTNNGEGTILVNENIYENSFFMPSRTVTVKTHKFDSDGFCTECGAYQPATKNNGKYEIGNAGQLFWFAGVVNGTLDWSIWDTQEEGVLTADIVIPDGKTWTPIGSNQILYQGTFDGRYHKISNLRIEAPEGFSIGLFGASTGTIKCLTVENVSCGSVSGNYVGGICGMNYGTIRSCFADSVAWTNVGNNSVGSVCGYNGRDVGSISNCRSTNSTMQKTAASAAEELPLCGYNANSISGCTSDSGICLISDDGTISDCLSSGSYLCQNLRDGTIKDCYTTGSAFVLSKEGGTIDNCYYQAASETFNDNGSVGKTTAQFASGEVAYLLNGDRTVDGNPVWGQTLTGENPQAYPVLGGDQVAAVTKCDGTDEVVGYYNGTSPTVDDHDFTDNDGFCDVCDGYEKPNQDASGVYEIDNAGKLFWFADFCNNNDAPRSARLLNSIEIPKKADGSTRQWTPIGTEAYKYTGSFDGQGHTISGLYFNDSAVSYVGLFGYAKIVGSGIIQNVTVEGSFTGKYRVGGICGYLQSGTIRNCQNQASVNAVQTPGGICGMSEGNIEHCHNSGTITASADKSSNAMAGGICGYLWCGATIGYCSNSGTVTGAGMCIGGIAGSAGSNWTDQLKDCWNSGSIGESDTRWVGGIIGGQYSSSGTVKNCYSYGTVSALYNGGPICSPVSNGKLTNCFYLESLGTDSFDGTTAKTAAQFASGEVAYLLNNERTPAVWGQTLTGENPQAYPVLNGEPVAQVKDCAGTVKSYTNADSDVTLPHEVDETGKCSICNTQFVASATINGETSYYETFLEASTQVYLSGNGTLTLLAEEVNTAVPSGSLIISGTFNLDLNGKTLNVNTSVYVENSEVQNGEAELNVLGGAGSKLILAEGEKLYVESGKANIQSGEITGDIMANGGALTITGGSFKGKIEVYNSATYSITGGEFVNLSNVPGSASSNMRLYQLPAEGYWFYSTRNVDEEGNYTYSNPVQYSDAESLEYRYNGSLYVGRHSHEIVFTSIDKLDHNGSCQGCGKTYFDHHSGLDDGFCDICGAGEISYVDAQGNSHKEMCFPITEDTKELTASPLSWYVVKDAGLLVENRITVKGSVNLILMDGKDLTVNGGIEVDKNKSLTIWGQTNGSGSLTCQNCNFDAGIGGTKNGACGSVTINGGNITTTGGGNSAGIGGSGDDGRGYVTGTIQINGGTVNATGGSFAPGIGGGRGRSAGTIVINGGFVTATGKGGAPGIGGGLKSGYTNAKQDGDGGNVSISNATVIANGIGGPGGNGTLSISNNSVVISDYIKDQTQMNSWNGIVFIANAGEVYGDVTLSKNLTIPAGKNLTLDMTDGVLTLNGAKISLGENSSLKLSGEGSFPMGVSVQGGYLRDLLADGWAFYTGTSDDTIIPLSATQYTTFPETDESPLVYLRAHTHSWSYSGITEDNHAKTCSCMSDSVTEAHTLGDDGFCTLCGAGMVSYVDAKGNDKGQQLCIALAGSSTALGKAGETTWYVVKDTLVEISDRIELSGNVNLILADGCLLDATKGIHVPEGSSLTIWCQQGKTGMLDASGADGAGIGGNENNYKPDVDSTTGSITINGGNITAYGGWGDAAIGGAFNGSSGSVTINGGSVNAFGGGPAAETNRWGGAGIGGGLYGGAGTIQINGGTVYAVGAEAAAGIGGGGSGYGGSVEITGGHVTAIGGSENTSYSFGLNGIGSGDSDDIPVTIKGGTVICVAGNTTEGYAGKAYKSAPTIDSGYGSYKVTVAGTLEGLADGSPVDCASRTGAFTGNAAVKLEPCKSHSRSCEDKEDGIQHVHLCQYCGKIEGTEKHTAPDENGMCPDCGVKILAAVEEDGGSTGYYSDFLAAFDAANGLEDSTLKLLADVYAKNMLEVSGSFTLDLNGKTLTSDYFEYGDQDGAIWDDNGAICVPYDCSLTIQDSSEDKTGGIFMNPNPDLDDDHKNALAVKGGTLNFSGGSVNYRIRNEMGTLNISGSAKVEVGKDDTAVINVQPYYPTQKSRTVISGGTLIGGTCINAEGDTEVEITGGTFKALAGNSDDYSSCVNCVAGGSVTVSGGTFMKEQGDNVYTFMGNNISVSGGEFIDGISVSRGNLKDRLAKNENGEIAYWYYQKLENGVYSGEITAADAAAASYGSTVYVGSHSHAYSSEDGTCVCGKQMPVAVSIGGETQFFDSLSAAMASLDTSAEEKAQVTVFQSTSFQNDLVIPENVTLTVKDGATLTAENNARLFVRNSLSGSVSGDVRYLVSVNTNEVNVTGRSVTVYLGSVYARADDPINLEAINYDADSMMLTDWLVNNESSSESFTMPSHPVTIERKLEAIVATVTILGNTTPYTNLYSAFDAANETNDNVIIELKADVVLGNDSPAMLTGGDVIFRGWEHTISGNEPGDWEHRNGYIAVRGGTNLTIESGTIASSAFLYCVPGSIVTVKNGSIDTLIVEGGKLTVEPSVDEENNPVGNIRVENLEVRGFSVGDVQLNGGSYGSITVPEDKDVSDLLADGFAYKLTDGSWEDDWNGSYTEAILEATVLPVPVKIITEPQDRNITYGDNESLTVTANPEESSYQWYEVIPDPSETPQTKAITGETGSTLKLNTFNAGTHEFFCEATVDGYKAVSKTATVKVDPRTLDIQWDGNTFQYDGQYHPKFTIGNTANGDQVFPVLQSGNEPQKNVGSYTVGVIDFVANGTDGFSKHGNYKLGATYRDFSITAKPITVNITANGGTYGEPFDGATAELVGVVAGETVPVTLTYTSASGYNSTTVPTDAGTYTVTATIKDQNYQLTGTTTAEFVVNKATNGWTTEPSVSDWTYGETSTVNSGAASFGTVQVTYYQGETKLTAAPTNAGSYKVCFDVEGTSNYSALHEEKTFTIEKRQLSIASAEGYERSYDGTNAFKVLSFTYENMIEGDQVHIGTPDSGHLVTVSSANVGTYDKATLPDNLALTGDDADNYTLVKPTGPVDTQMTISPKEVTFSGITAKDKDYDATTQVTLDYSGLQISGLVTGDNLSVSVTAAFEDANAGQNKTVAFTNPVLTGESKDNYVLKGTGNQTGTTATINPLEISIENVTVDNKVYDGKTDAKIGSIGSLSKNLDGGNLTIVSGTASFETANADKGKTVSFQGFELSGSAKDNYRLSGQPEPTTADITPATVKKLTLKASSATYDGNAKVPVIVAVTSENDLTLTGSDYQVSYQDASDSTVTELRNAGEYTVTVTGNGNFQGEATASYTIAKAKPTVTPATLTITYGTKLSGCDLSGFKASFGGKELPGSFAFDQPDTMPHVSDSGVTIYKLTFTPDDTVNFEKVQLETKVTVNKKELTVNVAVQDKQYNGTSEAFFVDGTPTLAGVVTGDKVELTYGNPYFTDVAENKDIAISFTEAFAITGDDSGNYYLTQPTGITASIYNSFTAAKGEDGSYTVSTNEWTNQDFVVTAQEGFQLSLTNTATGEWSDTLTVTTEGEADLKFYVRSADGAISNQASEHYKLDKTAPTGSIFFDETDQTAGTTPVVLYRNAAVNAGITGSDDRSGVKDLAWAAFKQAQEPSSITDWNTGDSFQLTTEDGTERHVYLKVVDNAGNVAYFRANTILFDTTKPSITGVDGVEKGTTYYTTQTAAVSDDYLDAVTLNGDTVTLNEDGKTASVKLTGNVDRTYSIKATDKAGNESTVTVIMKPISAITDPFKNLTGENITEDDRKSLEDTKDILEDLLKTTTDENEKQKLQDELDKLQKLLDVLDKVKEVEELLRDLPDDVEPDVDADTEQKIKDARKALDDLTDHQEDLVEDDLIEKLERLEDELVDYKFLEGDGSTWNRGSGKAARFVGNGRLDKLDKVILDGTELTTGFTKNTPKTTIDLQAAFLQSLELGEHTLKLVYTDGEAEAKFTVKQSPNYLDLTGNPDFDDQTEVDVGGERYPIEEIGGRYVNLPESGDLLTTYTYLAGNAAGTHDNYPIGMRVFRINRSEDGTTVTEITEFADLLQYSGCSIRVSGKRGIRMITSMTKSNKAALKGKGLAGFTMLEYGTVVQWADTLGGDDLTLNSGNHNYAYKRGVADPVFGTSGSLTQYTNVLVGFGLEECSKDIVMRPYIILQDAEGNQYTLYGGLVTRSISYIAWQNRDTYKPGTAAYKYVHELMGDLDTPAEGG